MLAESQVQFRPARIGRPLPPVTTSRSALGTARNGLAPDLISELARQRIQPRRPRPTRGPSFQPMWHTPPPVPTGEAARQRKTTPASTEGRLRTQAVPTISYVSSETSFHGIVRALYRTKVAKVFLGLWSKEISTMHLSVSSDLLNTTQPSGTLNSAELKGAHHRVYYFGNHFDSRIYAR
jgi:hypothetical protein